MAKIDLSLGKLGLQARDDAARHRLRLGLHDHARRREVRRQRHRPDAVGEPEAAHREALVRQLQERAHDGGAPAAVGGVRRARSTGSCRSAPSSTSASTSTTTTSRRPSSWLPDDGVMMLHTIIIPEDEEIKAKKLPLTMSRVRFIKFIMDEIYPGGRLPLAARSRSTPSRPATPSPASSTCSRTTCKHAGHLGGQPRGQEGRGHRDHLRGDLRAVPEVPDRLRRSVPRGLHRRRASSLARRADSSASNTQREVNISGSDPSGLQVRSFGGGR